jgi:hypothetical protein
MADYQIPDYFPSPQVQFFHETIRVFGDNNQTAWIEEGSPGNSSYTQGVAFFGGLMIAIAMLTILAFFCAGFCKCCLTVCPSCRNCPGSCCKEDPEKDAVPDKVPATFWLSRILYLVTILGGLYGAMWAMDGNATCSDAYEAGADSATDLGDWINGVLDMVDEFQAEVDRPIIICAEIMELCGTEAFPGGAAGPYERNVWNMYDALIGWNDTASDIPGILSVVPDLTKYSDDIRSQDTTRATFTDLAFVAVGGILVFCGLAVLLAVIQTSCRKSCGPLNMCVTALSFLIRPVGIVGVVVWFILGGVLFIQGVFLGDTCIDPRGNFPALVNVTTGMGDDVRFYMTGHGESRVAGGIQSIVEELEDVQQFLANITASQSQCEGSADMVTELNAAWAPLEALTLEFNEFADVQTLNPIFVDIFEENLCGHVVAAFYEMWLGMMISGGCLLLALWFYSPFTFVSSHTYTKLTESEETYEEKDVPGDRI